MLLKKLEITQVPNYRKDWKPGMYEGKAHFGDERGDVSLNLSAEHVDQIFHLCADGIIETARRAARDMTCAVIEQREGAALTMKGE